jgi:hypothetical protein
MCHASAWSHRSHPPLLLQQLLQQPVRPLLLRLLSMKKEALRGPFLQHMRTRHVDGDALLLVLVCCDYDD